MVLIDPCMEPALVSNNSPASGLAVTEEAIWRNAVEKGSEDTEGINGRVACGCSLFEHSGDCTEVSLRALLSITSFGEWSVEGQ